jgi:site-specific recombinase XerD
MKNKEIQFLIADCIVQMRMDGYDEKCIETHQRRWKKGIVSYMEKTGATQFSPKIGELFLSDVLPGLAAPTQRAHCRSIHLLEEFMQTGIVRRKIVKLHEFPLKGEIGSVVIQHLNCLRELRRCELTIYNHRRLLSYFIEGLTQKGINKVCDITEEAIVEFVDHAQTCKSEHFYAIRQFCSFLYEKGLTSTNLSYVLARNNFPQHEKLPSVYNSDEIKLVEDSIEQSSAVGKRDYAIFLFASRLGLRVSDIAALTWDNIDWDNGKITLYQCKTKVPVELPLLKIVGEALVIYARDSRPKSHFKEVFLSAKAPYRPMTRISLNGVVTRIMQSSSIDTSGRRFGPHSMRHSLASNMLRQGISLPTISSVLGHESTQTTMEYLRVDVTNLRECVLDVPLVEESFYSQKGGVFYD